MSKTVIVSIATEPVAILDGITPGKFHIAIMQGDTVIATQDVDEATATFADIPAGDYTVSAQRNDSAGTAMAPAVTTSFTVPADAAATYDSPVSVTVSIS